MDEESNPTTTTATSGAASTIIRATTTEATINSNKSISIGRSKCGSNNMETKGMNIPTDSLHAESKSSGNKGSISNEPTERRSTTTQEGTIDIDSSIICPSTRVSSNISTSGHHHQHSDSNASTLIDPLKKSTTNTLALADSQQGEGNNKGKETVTREKPASSSTSLISTSSTTTVPITTKSRSLCATDNVSSHKTGSGPHLACDSNNSEREADTKGAIVVNNNLSSKPPVPNFRVEGSGSGDSSITAAAVASLSSAVSAVTLHSSGGRGSTAGTNSLENNGEQPGSSGPVSIQSSSEEMRLSLVSWYSEPENPSGLIEGCCSALNTYRQDESGIVQDVGGHRDSCDSNSIMGLDASSTNDSPVCKSESEEKENKTPEPSGNIDKATITSQNKTDGMFVKSEFVNPNSSKKIDGDGCIAESQNCESLVSKSDGIVVAKSNSSKGGVSTDPKPNKGGGASSTQKTRTHVHVSEQRQSCTGSAHHHTSTGGHAPRCQQQDGSNRNKPECPRCSRRSKSGTTTPASGAQTRTRTPASRRVVQSSKSSTEIKKPIKSILKHDSSRGSAGSSGSDKQSSMDSLGSSGDIGVTPVHVLRGRLPNALMTRSDSGARARFHFSTNTSDTPTCAPEDKMVSKLKRIEKYATLRVRKSVKPRPLDLSDSEGQPSNDAKSSSSSGRVGGPGAGNEIMSKSMSYLEKSSNKVHITSAQGHAYGESTSASSTLRRQGSLRVRKSTSQWEPPGTRTSVLRLQKMQEAKAKNSPYAVTSSTGSGNSGSAHSGSGDSLHYLPHSANSNSASGGSSGMSSIHLTGTHSAPIARMNASAAAKEKHMGAKIFSKLSSASGQTASSNQKRLKQERGIQTDTVDANANGRSPVPALVDTDSENVEQIKNLERLCNRYKNQFMKIQSEYEQSESKKVDLQKQLEEAQVESTEMIEFLQAEKSTLAESLTEVEVEAKKWKEEMEAVKRDYQSRCSSLVRLSEQHKQEALKSQALLNRLESQSSSAISQLTHQITDGAQSIHQTKQRVTALTESLLKIYKVPPELLAATETNQTIKETDLSCSLLLPLITSLSAAFPMVPVESLCAKPNAAVTMSSSNVSSPMVVPGKTSAMVPMSSETENPKKKDIEPLTTNSSNTSTKVAECSSLFSLNQAILEREAAEKSGLLDDIIRPFGLVGGGSPDADQLSLRKEITDLNAAIAKLLNVVRVIVIHCDRKVSCVASSILQCLKSMEDDKVGNIAEIAQVQKSLEAWSDKGISTGSNSSSGSPPCKPSVTSASVTDSSSASYLVGNGHARV